MAKRKPAAPLTTPQLIELAKLKLRDRLPLAERAQEMTDYRFAKTMGLRQNLVSNWQLGKSRIGRQFVTKFAEVTGLPEAYVFACVELEREKDPGVRGVLYGLAAQFAELVAKRAAAIVLAAGMGMLGAVPTPSQAAMGGPAMGPGLYIMSNRRWGRARLAPASAPGR